MRLKRGHWVQVCLWNHHFDGETLTPFPASSSEGRGFQILRQKVGGSSLQKRKKTPGKSDVLNADAGPLHSGAWDTAWHPAPTPLPKANLPLGTPHPTLGSSRNPTQIAGTLPLPSRPPGGFKVRDQ